MGQTDSHLFFKNDEGDICFCEDCISTNCYLREDLALYERHGLKLQHGMKIELTHCLKAAEIMQERLNVLHQPAKLEVLAALEIKERIAHSPKPERNLPLPKSIIWNMMEGRHYENQVQGNFAKDTVFHSALACKLSGILWYHVGHSLVCDGTPHPRNG